MDITRNDWIIEPESHGSRLIVVSEDEWYSADATWDGCVSLYENNDREEKLTIHICDVDDFIVRLQKLKHLALLHFGDTEWPACAPNMPAE